MTFKTITIQDQSFIVPSWQEMGDLCFTLSKNIIESKKKYDRIVALAKGGWTWARAVSDYTGIHNVATIQYEFYADIGKTNKTPRLKLPLPVSVKDERLLVIDDVVDSGETVIAAHEYLKKSAAQSVETASLFYKPRSSVKPDYYAAQTDAWVIFPHEIREMVELLNSKWKRDNLSDSEIKKNFKTLGLPEDQVNYFLTIRNA
ncbi:phosphoribosyltransferase [Candidatus Roizmanbacteria bacterium]|nr:phosphoribosyltransferase [Candidatus Roizmanbacteria bacterium]